MFCLFIYGHVYRIFTHSFKPFNAILFLCSDMESLAESGSHSGLSSDWPTQFRHIQFIPIHCAIGFRQESTHNIEHVSYTAILKTFRSFVSSTVDCIVAWTLSSLLWKEYFRKPVIWLCHVKHSDRLIGWSLLIIVSSTEAWPDFSCPSDRWMFHYRNFWRSVQYTLECSSIFCVCGKRTFARSSLRDKGIFRIQKVSEVLRKGLTPFKIIVTGHVTRCHMIRTKPMGTALVWIFSFFSNWLSYFEQRIYKNISSSTGFLNDDLLFLFCW